MANHPFYGAKNYIEKRGMPVRFKYFNQSFNTGSYDDDTALTQSGSDVWISGLPQPLRGTKGSKDAVLMEQGLVTTEDIKCYVQGNVNTNGIFKVGIGSPTFSGEYSVIEEGTSAPLLNGSAVYRKLYLRQLSNGSLFGES